jgi:hypothetical protein
MKLIKYLLIIAFAIGMIAIGCFSCIEKQKEKIALLEEKIELLKEEHTPIKFKISEKTEDEIKVTIKFYNADNEEVNKLETTVPGQELSFDFYVVPVKEKYVAFPSKLFSNVIAASNGTSLYDLYDKNGFPEIFQSKSLDPELKQGLEDVLTMLKQVKWIHWIVILAIWFMT